MNNGINMKNTSFISLGLTALLIFTTSACTNNKALYEIGQGASSSRCTLMPPEEKKRCEADLNKQTYEEYEQTQKDLKNNAKK